jgi:TP901 family phage tail tape measure protein
MADGKVTIVYDGDTSGIDKANREAESKISQVGSKLASIAKASAIAIGAAFVAAGAAAIKFGGDMEAQMANLSAITGMTEDELALVEEGIRKIATETGKDVIELAQNAKMVAEAGGDITLMLEQMTHGTNLAIATETDMATTLDFLGSVMKTFGVEAEDTQGTVDSFAYVTTLANITLAQLGESFVNVGGSAASAGLGIDDVNAVLVTLSNNGLKGGAAGTSLNAVLKNLSTPTNTAATALDELGVALYDTDGASRDMFDIMLDLESALGGLTDQQRKSYEATIFDTVALSSWNMLTAEGVENVMALSDELATSSEAFDGLGQAAGMTGIITNTFHGQIAKLKEQIKDFAIELFQDLQPVITDMLPVIKSLLDKLLPTLSQLVQKLLPTLVGIIEKVLPPFLKLIDKILPVLIKLFDGFGKAIGEIVTAVLPILVDLIDELMPIFENLGAEILPILIKLWKDLAPPLLALVKEVLPVLVSVLTNLLPPFIQLISNVLPVLIKLFDNLAPVILEVAAKVLPLLVDVIQMLLPFVLELIETVLPLLVSLFDKLIPIVLELAAKVLPVLVSIIEALLPLVFKILEAVLPFIISLLEILIPVIVTLIENVLPILVTIINALVPILEMVLELLTPILELIIALLEPILDLVLAALKPFLEILSPIIEVILQLINMALKPLTEAFKATFENVVGSVLNIVNGIKTHFEQIIDFFKNVFTGNWQAAWENCKNIFVNIWNTMKEAIKAPINFIIDAVNKIIGGLNSLSIKIPDWVPFVGGNTWGVNIPVIPRLKKGAAFIPSDFYPAYLDYGERVLTQEQNIRFNAMGGMEGMEKALSGTVTTSQSAVQVQNAINLTADVELDGFKVGKIVLHNLDDVKKYT